MNTATVSKKEEAELKNQAATAVLKDRGLRRAKNDRVWDWVNDVSRATRNFFQAPAVLLPLLKNDTVNAQLQAQGKVDDVVRLVKTISQDLVVYMDRFRVVHAKHASRRGSSYDADDLVQSIMIGQDYIGLVEAYNSTITPNMAEVLEILEGAGMDTSTVRAAQGGRGLVYQLMDNKPSSSQDSPAAE